MEDKDIEKIREMVVDIHFQTLDITTESGRKFSVELTPTG